MTFQELRNKEVINVCDGRRLGCVCDIIIDDRSCRVEAIMVPGSTGWLHCLTRKSTVIPWGNIRKIGDDVILADAGDLCPR